MAGKAFNETAHFLNEEVECLLRIHHELELVRLGEAPPLPPGSCLRSWDSLLCWPPTQPGVWASLACFPELNGIKYDTSLNASRFCHPNGTWDNYTDYASCKDLNPPQPEFEPGIEVSTMIYSGGYALSLIALLVAVWIFLYFKDLRCLRNTIHTNLMCTYILADFMWILNITLQMSMPTNTAACICLVVMLHYFHLTNFFWMFVEGLYLYMLVVETFTSKNIKLRAYVCIGWGVPSAVILVWSIVKSLTPLMQDTQSQQGLIRNCPWMTPHQYDWIYQGPAAVILVVNFVFLIMIMWVLITKLRSANTAETQQYRKATKALLVLIPLLGITYILVIYGPTEGVSANIYAYCRAVLLSTQGFTVALFYCFLNTEVQNTLRHRAERWKEARDVGGPGGRRYTYSKDWSPNTRTESIRLYSSHQVASSHYRKRESTVSETTTMTLVGPTGGGGSNRVSNGSMGPPGVAVRATPASPYLEAAMENAV